MCVLRVKSTTFTTVTCKTVCYKNVIPVVAMSHLPEFVMDMQANEVVVLLSSCNNQSKNGVNWLSHMELDWFYKPENIKKNSHESVVKKDIYTSVRATVSLKKLYTKKLYYNFVIILIIKIPFD